MARKPKAAPTESAPEVTTNELDLFDSEGEPTLVVEDVAKIAPEIVTPAAPAEEPKVEPVVKAKKPKRVPCKDCPKFTRPDKECELCWAEKRSERGE